MKIVLSGTYGPCEWANIFALDIGETGGGASMTDVTDVLDAFAAAWTTNVFPLLSAAVEVTLAKAVYISLISAEEYVVETPLSDTGSIDGEALSAQAAAVLSWPINAYYRGGKPRTYVPGIPVADLLDVGHFTSGFTEGLEAAGTAVLAAANDISHGNIVTAAMGIISYAADNAWRDPPIFRKFTGNPLVRSRIDTQRRRLGKEPG